MQVRAKVASVAVAAAAIGAGVALAAPSASADRKSQIQHVLLISVDGMHQSDLAWYASTHPHSALAKLATGGQEYTNDHTSDPSDSDPGGTAIMTGGDPKVTGIYYDDEYSHDVFPAGTTNCSGPVPGGNVIYDSPDDKLANVPDLLNNGSGNTFPSFDEGGSIYPNGDDTDPGKIMNLSDHPQSGLNPATYPVDPKTCKPIQPWDFLGVNTIFQVIHNAGMRTAYSEKHAIYSSFNGPGSNGMSIDDFFGPEIDSQAVEPNGVPYPVDGAWTADNAATTQYDSLQGPRGDQLDRRVRPLRQGSEGRDPGESTALNFQTSVDCREAEELPGGADRGRRCPGRLHRRPVRTSRRVLFKTVDGVSVPGPLLQSALGYINDSLQRMINAIQANGEAKSTAIILTAKHGQSP